MEFKEIIEKIQMAQIVITSFGEKYEWSREKKIAWKWNIRKIINLLEVIRIEVGEEKFGKAVFASATREIYDIIPTSDKINGIPKDRLYSVSLERFKDLNDTNQLFLDASGSLIDEELFKRIALQMMSTAVKLKEDQQFYQDDFDEYFNDLSMELLTNNLLINGLLNFKLKFITENFDYWFDILCDRSSWKGASHTQIINSLGLKYLNGLEPNVIIQPFAFLLIGANQIQVSKETSDKYIVKVLEILNEQLELRESKLLEVPHKFKDTRIKVGSTRIDIQNYFYQLTTIIGEKTGKPIVSEIAINHLLGENIKEFDVFNMNYKLDLGIKKGHIRYFVYSFYRDFDNDKSNNKLKMYVDFLIKNFVDFENDDHENLYKRMSKKPPKDYPFS
jgi:hypothetical protein